MNVLAKSFLKEMSFSALNNIYFKIILALHKICQNCTVNSHVPIHPHSPVVNISQHLWNTFDTSVIGPTTYTNNCFHTNILCQALYQPLYLSHIIFTATLQGTSKVPIIIAVSQVRVLRLRKVQSVCPRLHWLGRGFRPTPKLVLINKVIPQTQF